MLAWQQLAARIAPESTPPSTFDRTWPPRSRMRINRFFPERGRRLQEEESSVLSASTNLRKARKLSQRRER
jgi:hypothetical protein